MEVGAPIVPYASADPGKPREHVRILVKMEHSDIRKGIAEKQEGIEALEYEAAICVVDDELLAAHDVPVSSCTSSRFPPLPGLACCARIWSGP